MKGRGELLPICNLYGRSGRNTERAGNYSTDAVIKTDISYADIPVENIRNFSIIAHVDHGKSTLADRVLETTGAIRANSGNAQVLDKLQVERERGITVKAQSASLLYKYGGTSYLLNLIDTPGHVDFSNEDVNLLVDSNDGVQAQTVANFYLIDLKNADPDRVCKQLETLLPPPCADRDSAFKALLFDSWYDRYKGVQALVYVESGQINVIPFIGLEWRVEPLKGFQPVKPMVFAGIYPVDQSQHVNLRNAIEKLALNDSAVSITIDASPALGQGWRLGFLGLLHLEVFTQRLQQEYDAETILTAPSVTYKIKLNETKQTSKTSTEIFITNPVHFPDPLTVEEYYEPMVLGEIKCGHVLCMEKRGVQRSASNIDNERVMMQFDLPLSEIVIDFHDSLKTISSGYASFDYEPTGFVPTYLVKMEIFLNGVAVDELSNIVHGSRIDTIGRKTVLKLKEIIPRQQVQIAIQAKVNGKVIARETLKAYRKDVAAKLYGGDITRRMKLLAQQAAGKKKMRMVANISLPRETFIDVLKK
ncbi:hypothetical protein RI129_000068 [Pyrocoelia pectoralis]|uniref:Tr-type G domain-containing protein n=1 Tax=Pyrocoelia pectoralis TaxID=417401 RepID=A0AAN7URX6_9COLE